ncbi:RNA polymerase sigma factor [Actinomadura kijaniata]|uniref:RNA polymerase sigma factor n=1 Tax=Actinomadura kijaniata TaxID=46161 RepID=UPI000A547E40|nr:sigma-70 family RNA polymerase sigma factor [Actinomadura kijaniata]
MNDDDGFTRMFRDHYEAVLRYAWRRVGPADAADVAAETFRIAWERRDRLPDDDPRPWLYATARNVTLNLVRRDRRRDGLLDALADDLGRRDGEGDHAATVAARQTALAALAGLGERERELVMLVCWEGLDLKSAAEAAGCSRTAAAMRLHRARKRLRHLLGDTPPGAATPAPASPQESLA